MLETLDQQLQVFLPKAKELMMDVTLRTKLSFESNDTQAAFNLFSQAYWMGANHATKEFYRERK